MSDDEDYEYEYDDDASMQDDEDQGGDDEEEHFEYTDEEEPADDIQVELENLYYNSKGLRETDLKEAQDSFEQVIKQEQEELERTASDGTKKYGPWSFKAMKQLVKLHLRAGDAANVAKDYHRLLDCIANGEVSPNQIEKGINGMLERVASLYQGGSHHYHQQNNSMDTGSSMNPQALALQVYDATLKTFHPKTGSCQNERLWFKTNIKYGQLLYEMNETNKLKQVLKDLQAHSQNSVTGGGGMGSEGSTTTTTTSSTQTMEIYALQIQLYYSQRDHKSLRQAFYKAMAVRGGLPHPRTLALIQELGGKMHMEAKQYEDAGKTFFQAFKSYDEAGDPARLKCLQYLVLASMLHASTINPFDSQEARPYRDDPEILAMTNLVQAFHNNDINSFEKILQSRQGRSLRDDEFIRQHIDDLLRTIRTQVLQKSLQPYTRIRLQALADEHLNKIAVSEVEALLVRLILQGSLDAKIDKTEGVLYKRASTTTASTTSSNPAPLSSSAQDDEAKQLEALTALTDQLELVSKRVTSMVIKEHHHHHVHHHHHHHHGPGMGAATAGGPGGVGAPGGGGFRGMIHM